MVLQERSPILFSHLENTMYIPQTIYVYIYVYIYDLIYWLSEYLLILDDFPNTAVGTLAGI